MYTEEQRRGHIYDLQRFLRRIQLEANHPSPLVPDGVYGPETAAAVREFQRANGLPVTGTADYATWTLIYEQYAILAAGDGFPICTQFFPPDSDAKLSPGDKGYSVYALQLILNTLATHFTDAQRVPVTGVYDENTTAAVQHAQAHFKLPQTGVTDRDTWDALASFHNVYHHRPPLSWTLAEREAPPC